MNKYIPAFFLITGLALSASAYGKDVYTIVDEFTGDVSYKSNPILKGGGWASMAGDTGWIQIGKILPGPGSTMEIPPEYKDDDAVWVFHVKFMTPEATMINEHDSLIFKVDEDYIRFSGTATYEGAESIPMGNSSVRQYTTRGLYIVKREFLDRLASSASVEARVLSTKTTKTFLMKKKGRKALNKFLSKVP